jgi:iron uptake system component EfeO
VPAVSFPLTLGGGVYQLYCPGAAAELQDFTVTGPPATPSASEISASLNAGAAAYTAYVGGVIDAMVTAVDTLDRDIQAGNLDAAKVDYARARPYYERIESDVRGFVLPGHAVTDNAGNLDYLIDMRASNLDPAVGWHGFHAIERDLFQAGQITAGTKQLSTELARNVATLGAVAKGLAFTPLDLANGAAGLLEEVQAAKITGEEEAYSHLDLVDFAANIEGAHLAFAFLEPGLLTIDPALTARVNDRFNAVKALLDSYRDPSQLGGYRLYTDELKASAAAPLSQAVQALQEPLSQLAEKVATAG